MRNLKTGLATISSVFMLVSLAFTAQAQEKIVTEPQLDVQSTSDSNSSFQRINWCRLQYPQVVHVNASEESELIFGQLYIRGCTEGAKNCEGVKAEFGYGIRNDDPRNYTYIQADINPKFTTETLSDEYMLRVRIDKPGEYAMLYRFSTDNGRTWVYCDFDDEPGFNIGKTGSLIVK